MSTTRDLFRITSASKTLLAEFYRESLLGGLGKDPFVLVCFLLFLEYVIRAIFAIVVNAHFILKGKSFAIFAVFRQYQFFC